MKVMKNLKKDCEFKGSKLYKIKISYFCQFKSQFNVKDINKILKFRNFSINRVKNKIIQIIYYEARKRIFLCKEWFKLFY